MTEVEFCLQVSSLIKLPCIWTPWTDAHLDFILGSHRAGQCVLREVMSQQERVGDLCKWQAEPGTQPRHPDSPPHV